MTAPESREAVEAAREVQRQFALMRERAAARRDGTARVYTTCDVCEYGQKVCHSCRYKSQRVFVPMCDGGLRDGLRGCYCAARNDTEKARVEALRQSRVIPHERGGE